MDPLHQAKLTLNLRLLRQSPGNPRLLRENPRKLRLLETTKGTDQRLELLLSGFQLLMFNPLSALKLPT